MRADLQRHGSCGGGSRQRRARLQAREKVQHGGERRVVEEDGEDGHAQRHVVRHGAEERDHPAARIAAADALGALRHRPAHKRGGDQCEALGDQARGDDDHVHRVQIHERQRAEQGGREGDLRDKGGDARLHSLVHEL